MGYGKKGHSRENKRWEDMSAEGFMIHYEEHTENKTKYLEQGITRDLCAI